MLVVRSCQCSPSPSVCSLSRQTLGVEVQQNRLTAPPVEGSDLSTKQHILKDGEKRKVAFSAVSPQQSGHQRDFNLSLSLPPEHACHVDSAPPREFRLPLPGAADAAAHLHPEVKTFSCRCCYPGFKEPTISRIIVM